MVLITTENIHKDYSGEIVLSQISFQVKRGQKFALLGANGSGKTTLLKIIAGTIEPDSGRVMVAKGCKIGYQSQKLALNLQLSVLEEGLSVFAHLAAQEAQLRQLETELAGNQEHILNKYAQLSHEFEENGGYSYPARTRSTLSGLGFRENEYAQPVGTLSGGQQNRLALAKLLLSDSDLLLLDEPTNHLDIDAINWLENYLKSFAGGLLLVSHDRRFLENLVDTVGELAEKRLSLYPGGYSNYLQERERRQDKLLKDYQAQQEYIKRTEDFIARNLEGQKTKQAQSRRRELEKLQRLQAPPPPHHQASFKFEQRRPSGRHVLNCQGLAKSFPGKQVLNNISFRLERGERAGLIGPNGCGKTTLLELICRRRQPDKGSITYGHYVETAYYSQMRDDIAAENSAATEIWQVRPAWTRGEIQSFLARFLFRGEEAFKLVKHMSGGEASRLALAKLLLSKANFLILDEPTNHLDLDSREVLVTALQEFPGTILVVSHDRWFLNSIVTTILEITPQGIQRFLGDYDYWQGKKDANLEDREPLPEVVKALPNKPPGTKLSPNEIFRRQQQLHKIEAEIAQGEKRQTQLNTALIDPGLNHEKRQSLAEEAATLNTSLNGLYKEWELVAKELEESQ